MTVLFKSTFVTIWVLIMLTKKRKEIIEFSSSSESGIDWSKDENTENNVKQSTETVSKPQEPNPGIVAVTQNSHQSSTKKRQEKKLAKNKSTNNDDVDSLDKSLSETTLKQLATRESTTKKKGMTHTKQQKRRGKKMPPWPKKATTINGPL
jgi:preprotein translocase subunit SecF